MLQLTNPVPTDFNQLRLDLNRLQLACGFPIVKDRIYLGTQGHGDLYLTIEGPSPVIEHPPTPDTFPDSPGFKAHVRDTIADGRTSSRYEVTAPNASPEVLAFIAEVVRRAVG